MKTHKILASTAILAMLPMASSAATIAWDTSVNMYQGTTVETFVSTTGTTAVAYNNTTDITSGDTDVTVNGVAFTATNTGSTLTGAGGESITINGGTDNLNAFGDGEFSSNAGIFHLIRGATFAVSSVTLGGLQSGHTYQIQVFNNDARGSRHLNFVTRLDDGNGGTTNYGYSQLNNSPTDGSAPTFPETDAGDSILGTFTADSATMTILVAGGTGGAGGSFTAANSQSQINAIQLRTLEVPEPSSTALLGLGGLALILRRRK